MQYVTLEALEKNENWMNRLESTTVSDQVGKSGSSYGGADSGGRDGRGR